MLLSKHEREQMARTDGKNRLVAVHSNKVVESIGNVMIHCQEGSCSMFKCHTLEFHSYWIDW